MNSFPPVTAVIVAWNGRHWLEQFVPPLLATRWPNLQVLVVDNASSDGTVDWLASNWPTIRVVRQATNVGFAQGNNLALPHINTPYFALVNSDLEVTPDWLAPLVETLERNPQIAAVQPKIRNRLRIDYFDYAGAAGGMLDRWGYAACRGRLFDTVEVDAGQYDQSAPVFWTSGACMLVRTAAVADLGFFESSFFAHWEEIDWCWRAQNAGWQLRFVPQSIVYHVGGGTLSTDSPYKLRLNLRNSLLTYVRNAPALTTWRLVVARLVLDGVMALRDLFRGRWQTLSVVLAAHIEFYMNLSSALHFRRGRTKRPLAELQGYWSGSFVWAYFVRRRRRWSDLMN